MNLAQSIVAARIGASFLSRANDRYLVVCELDLEFQDGLLLTPSIAVMPKRMIDWMHEPECCRDVPLLAIEINGGQQSFEELIDKRDLYFTHGVASVWVAHPMFKQIDIFCPQSPYPQIIKSGDAEDHATGLLVRIEEIFA